MDRRKRARLGVPGGASAAPRGRIGRDGRRSPQLEKPDAPRRQAQGYFGADRRRGRAAQGDRHLAQYENQAAGGNELECGGNRVEREEGGLMAGERGFSDPLEDWKRTCYCGEPRAASVGQEMILAGWVHTRRDHGGLIFVDLRDRGGITQVVFNPEASSQTHELAHDIRSEYVLAVTGTVAPRPGNTVNPKLPTGEIEVLANGLEILNTAKTPPFMIEDETDVAEMLRLKYRYLDLRRPSLQKTLITRHRITQTVRRFLDGHGFIDIETPFLTKSTPEGARDYLVPSRVNPGMFFALPQSPQLFKQILMVAGFERYYQIVKCFRDEDLRADRQPEFTQIDLEMSFIDQEEIMSLMEQLIAAVVKEVKGIDVSTPFPRLSYQAAMDRYGSDKPDTRFGLELKDISDIAKASDF